MSKIRALVVDDSVVTRQLLTTFIGEDPEIEVVGTAADGKIGLAKIAQLRPDVVVLDIEMPVMDGLQTLAAIRQCDPALPVIIFSAISEEGARTTLDALALGANDYATKPKSGRAAKEHIYEDLVPKIKALCLRAVTRSSTASTPSSLPVPAVSPASAPVGSVQATSARTTTCASSASSASIDVVAIGVSTGGPNALAAIMRELSRDLDVPVVIVQHMPPIFTRTLAERLAAISGLPVREGAHGMMVRPGEIWIAPGGYHMEVERGSDGVRLRTHQGPLENSCRPAVDVLFRTVANVYGARTLGVILTGMGQDGLRGCESIHECGGRIVVQDEASSVVWGMPGAVASAGLASKILPLPEIAAEINRSVKPVPFAQSGAHGVPAAV